MKSFKKYTLWLLGIVFGVTAFNLLFFSDNINLHKVIMMLKWTSMYTIVLGFGNGYLAEVLNKVYDWYTETRLRVWSGILCTILYSVFGSILVLTIMLVLPGSIPFEDLFKPRYINQHFYTTIISMVISLFFHLRGFLIDWKAQVKLNEESKRTALEAKLISLQKQMDAHFLFNSLSVLREVILEDQELAAKFVEEFSGVYRYIVQNSSKQLVKLEEELDFIQQYIFLHQTRFEDAIFVSYNLNDCMESKEILPLSIQIAVENAIRHNNFSEKHPLFIDINCTGESVLVKNNRSPKADSDGAGVALKNLKARIGLISNKQLKIDRSKSDYQIEIPLF